MILVVCILSSKSFCSRFVRKYLKRDFDTENYKGAYFCKSYRWRFVPEIFYDILHMSFLAGTHVFKAYSAYTTTEI